MDAVDHMRAALAGMPPGALVVGYSGGLDSTVLLHALSHCRSARARGLRVLHVDHGLHPDSAGWADHCRAVCAALGVPIDVVTVRVDQRGDGPEAAARRARWRAYADGLDRGREILVLAHHRDDQAETVLLRLMRGAGPAGLTAMRVHSARRNGLRVWRPLLGVGRAQIEEYGRALGLNWRDDPGNAGTRFDRNHLRHIVLPALRSRWPQADTVLARAAERQADAHALERAAGAALVAQASTPDPSVLRIDVLRRTSRVDRWAALRVWLAGQGARDIGAARLQRIDSELIDADADADPRLDLGGHVLRRFRNALHLLPPGADAPATYRHEWNGREALALPGLGVLGIEPAPVDSWRLLVTTRQGGEQLRMHADGPLRTLKHLLQEAAVPTWQRQRWPVIWLDGEIAGFADVVIGAALKARLDAAKARLRFRAH